MWESSIVPRRGKKKVIKRQRKYTLEKHLKKITKIRNSWYKPLIELYIIEQGKRKRRYELFDYMDHCESTKKKFQCSNGSTKCQTYLSQEMMNDRMWKMEQL